MKVGELFLNFLVLGGALGQILVNDDDTVSVNRIPKVGWTQQAADTKNIFCQRPCICNIPQEDVLIVDCSRAENSAALSTGLAWDAHELQIALRLEIRLIIISSELKVLSSNERTRIVFSHIHVKYNPALSDVDENFLDSSNATLSILDLRNNNFTKFPIKNIQGFSSLKFLSLDDNKISFLGDELSSVRNMVHLSITNNIIESISEGTFGNMPNLEFLDLHSNMIAALPKMIGSLTSLKSLLLWGNPITSIQPGLLSGLRQLKTLDLRSTKIQTLEPNSLTVPSSQAWLLTLSNTPLKTIHTDAFRNGILPCWMDIKNTKIKQLKEDLFSPIIRHMAEQNIIHTDWGKPQLWTDGNFLSCDCTIKWLITNTTLLRHVSGLCVDKNSLIKFLDPDYFYAFCF